MFRMNHVHIKTDDPQKTVDFYVETMGAKIVSSNPNGGYRIDLHGLSLNVTPFLRQQKREQKYGMEHIAIDTDELDALVAKLKDRGIRILEETVVSGGRRVCFFEGPDGVQLEFIEMKCDMAEPLRVGMIGAGGRWGPRAHAPALKGITQAELHAVCTAHADTAQAAADKFGVKRAYGDLNAMNADASVEAALVAVRVPAHYALSKAALEAGKHVYCEWPLGRTTEEAVELAALARKLKLRTMVGLQRRASPAYMHMRDLIAEGYVGKVLSVTMAQHGSGVQTRTADRTWQRDATLGANTLTITFGHALDAVLMVVGELAEVSAIVSTQVPQWFESDTKKFVDVTSPDNIMIQGRLESGAILNAYVGVHPFHGSGYRFEIYGTEGTLMMIGGGEAGQEVKRKLMGGRKDDKALQEIEVPERLKCVPEPVRQLAEGYDVAQMWVRFADAIRTGKPAEPDFDHAVRRHRTLDAIRRASETGQRQKMA